jgi:CHAT domain-containing protein/tetratricopeptide (TPR) repeat protein
MVFASLLVACLAAVTPWQDELPLGEPLVPGGEVRGEVGTHSPVAPSAVRDEVLAGVDLHGEPHPFDPGPGLFTLELRLDDLDAYLVLTNAEGLVLAEDDDGLGAPHARLLVEVEPGGGPFVVWACRPHYSAADDYHLRAVRGDAPLPTAIDEDATPEARVDAALARHDGDVGQALLEITDVIMDLRMARRRPEAARAAEHALTAVDPDRDDHLPALVNLHQMLLVILPHLQRRAEAVDLALTSVHALHALDDRELSSQSFQNLAKNLWWLGRLDEGLPLAEQAVRYTEELDPRDDDPLYLRRLRLLSSFQRTTGDFELAYADLPPTRQVGSGDTLEVAIVFDQDLYQHTWVVDFRYSLAPPRTLSLPFRVPEAGTWTIDLRSFDFDAYLVLRDPAGRLLAEDDDGRGLLDSRLVVELESGRDYVLEPTALHGKVGLGELSFRRGRPDQQAPEDLRRERLLEAREALEQGLSTGGAVAFRALQHAAALYGWLDRPDRILEVREALLHHARTEVGVGTDADLGASQAYASALISNGRGAEGVELMEELVAIHEARAGSEGVPLSLIQMLSRAWSRRGDHEQAERLRRLSLERVVRSTGPDSPQADQQRRSLARLLAAQGRVDEAVAMIEELVARYPDPVPPGAAYLVASDVMLLGDMRLLADDPQAAAEDYRESGDLSEAAQGNLDLDTALARMSEGWLVGRLGEAERGLAIWRPAHEVIDQQESSWQNTSLMLGADLLASTGDVDRALDLGLSAFDQSIDGLVQSLAVLPESLRLRRLGKMGMLSGLLTGLALREPDRASEVYERVLRLQGLAGRSNVESRARIREDLDEQTLDDLSQLESLQSELSQAWYAEDTARIESLRDRRLQLEERLTRHLGEGAAAADVDLAALSTALPTGSALLHLVVGSHHQPPAEPGGDVTARWNWWREQRVTAWVLRAGDAEVELVDLGDAMPLRDAAGALGQALGASRGRTLGRPARAADQHQELRRLLWDPVVPSLGGATRVLIAADGFLGTIPFEVLRQDDGTYLVEDHVLSYLADPLALLDLGDERPAVPDSLLVVGDVAYDDTSEQVASAEVSSTWRLRGGEEGGWPPLPFTAAEARSVADTYQAHSGAGRLTLLAGSDASEAALRDELERHAWVHIATHGFFRGDGQDGPPPVVTPFDASVEVGLEGLLPGLLSGLVLAGANGGGGEGHDDGLLTAEELTWIDLSACTLLTLSACETGLGSERGGEGLIGLRRALHLGGAASVVSSLWAVEDEATSQLMQSFCAHAWEGELSTVDALRTAQLELLEANRERFGEARPWTWGAFVLSGDWR